MTSTKEVMFLPVGLFIGLFVIRIIICLICFNEYQCVFYNIEDAGVQSKTKDKTLPPSVKLKIKHYHLVETSCRCTCF